MGRKGKTATDDPQDEGLTTEVSESTNSKVEVEEEKNGAQTEGKYFQYRVTIKQIIPDHVITKLK